MARLDQSQAGYLRGIRGAQLTRLLDDGTPSTADVATIDTATQANYEALTVEGAREALRGGDRVLAYYAERDHVVGHRITLTNARGHLLSLYIIQGGTLTEVADGTSDTRIAGWSAPRVWQQHLGPYFELVVYQASFNSSGGIEGYIKHTWPYCFGTLTRFNIQDQQWTAPELDIIAVEHPAGDKALYEVQFVQKADVPAALAWGL